MNNKPKVSVIVPIYNMERVLRRCLDSLVSQTEHDFEVILVDDGSTDNSADICEEYAGRDDRLRIVRKKNGGVCSARNAGLDIARGEYVACVTRTTLLTGIILPQYTLKQSNTTVTS